MATKRLDVVRKEEKEGKKTRWVRVGTIFLDSEFPSKPKPDAGGSW
jgi:hypothetical protein